MDRRNFIKTAVGATAGLAALSGFGCMSKGGRKPVAEGASDAEFYARCESLLETWGKSLLDLQIKSGGHAGAIKCPACDILHGRVGDAEYPFLYLAKKLGDSRYSDAAEGLFNWQEKFMSNPDGSWRNDFRNSWRGITAFRCMAMAGSISKYSDIIEPKHLKKMRDRLYKAGDFMYGYPWLGKPNANYVIGAAYSLALVGHVLDVERFRQRGDYYAGAFKRLVSERDKLVFGEIHPLERESAKGLKGIDIGYNIAETLPLIEAYSKLVGNAELRDYVSEVAAAHLEFVLPDGAIDGSFCTRSFKWSYWGSRTSDGCVAMFESLADRDARFLRAASANLRLLERCTADGLLAGGLHYASHGVKPCIHHSFVQMKGLADILTRPHAKPAGDPAAQLPREEVYGVKHFADVDTSLVSVGDWRATISAYDSVYYPKTPQGHPTGGTLSLLWNSKVGAVSASSMTEYALFEIDNMQPETDASFASLTPRIETVEDGVSYSSDKCLACKISSKGGRRAAEVWGAGALVDIRQNAPKSGVAECEMRYGFSPDCAELAFSCAASAKSPRITVPIICSSADSYKMVSANCAEIYRDGHTVKVESDRPLKISDTPNGRIFNHVCGFEAVPLCADAHSLRLRISVS